MLFKKTPIFRSSCWVTLFCLMGTSVTFDGRGTFLDVLTPRSRIPNQEDPTSLSRRDRAKLWAVTRQGEIGARQLSRIDDPMVLPTLIGMLKDPRSEVRSIGAQSLRERGWGPTYLDEKIWLALAEQRWEDIYEFGPVAIEILTDFLIIDVDVETKQKTAEILSLLGYDVDSFIERTVATASERMNEEREIRKARRMKPAVLLFKIIVTPALFGSVFLPLVALFKISDFVFDEHSPVASLPSWEKGLLKLIFFFFTLYFTISLGLGKTEINFGKEYKVKLPKYLRDITGWLRVKYWAIYWKQGKQWDLMLIKHFSISMIREIRHPLTIRYLRQGLRDQRSEIRREAVMGLTALNWSPETEEDQIWQNIAELNWDQVREFGVAAVAPLSFVLLNDPDKYIQENAARILYQLEDSRSIPILRQARDLTRNFPLRQTFERLIQSLEFRQLQYAL